MSIRDHGGFDIALDAAPAILDRQFDTFLQQPRPPTPVNLGPFAGTANTTLSGTGVRLLPGIEFVAGVAMDGSQIELDALPGFPGPQTKEQRTVWLPGTTTVREALDVAGLSVRIDGSADATRGTPEVATTLRLHSTPGQSPGFLESPPINFYLALLDDTQGALLKQELIDAARNGIQERIRAVLTDPPLVMDALAVPSPLAPGMPPTVAPISASTASGSLRVGIRLGGAGGDLARVERSNLAADDALALVLSNASLLRDFIRPHVDATLGLSPAGSFAAGDPCRWSGRATVQLPEGGTLELTQFSAVVGESQQVVLTLGIEAPWGGGAIVTRALLSVPVSVALTAGAGGLVATFTPQPATVIGARVDVAAWVYVAMALGGGWYFGPLLVAALAIADAVADAAVAGSIGGAVLPPVTTSLAWPPGLPALTLRSTSLFQGDAAVRNVSVTVGALSTTVMARDHDLVVRLAA